MWQGISGAERSDSEPSMIGVRRSRFRPGARPPVRDGLRRGGGMPTLPVPPSPNFAPLQMQSLSGHQGGESTPVGTQARADLAQGMRPFPIAAPACLHLGEDDAYARDEFWILAEVEAALLPVHAEGQPEVGPQCPAVVLAPGGNDRSLLGKQFRVVGDPAEHADLTSVIARVHGHSQ